MTRIIEHKTQAVTLGVMDKNLAVHEELQQVTYEDQNGTRHTIHAHVDGPFGSPEDIVQAHQEGVLHAFKDHDTAVQYAVDHGDHEGAERLRSTFHVGDQPTEQRQGGGY